MNQDQIRRASEAPCQALTKREALRPLTERYAEISIEDGCLPGLGAGPGNTPLEVFIAVCDRMGIKTGVDTFKAMDIAEDLIEPMMDHMVRIDRDALTLGYAGVYSSFLLFARRSAEKYKLSSRDILMELGRRGTVGGQEDMIEDMALTMAQEQGTIG